MLYSQLHDWRRLDNLQMAVFIAKYRSYSEFYDFMSDRCVTLTTDELNKIKVDYNYPEKKLKVFESSLSDLQDDYYEESLYYPDDDYWDNGFD